MGKWTPDYYEDVLSEKIKSLVSGAVQRSKLERTEKTEPTLSYRSFVEDLDAGDSFTTAMIELLVKELAERRARPSTADRHLISERTAKSLRTLAAPARVYRDRPGGRHSFARRAANLTDYLTAPADEMDMAEDDHEFQSMLEPANAPEGVRINAELYDAYGSSHSWAALGRLRPHPFSVSPLPTAEETTPFIPSPLHSPSGRSNPWSVPSIPSSQTTTSTTFLRPTSLRRPLRTRTVDFNDFTRTRRSAIRQSSPPEQRSDSHPRSLSPIFREASPAQEASSSTVRPPQSARRFFPFSRNRRYEPSGNLPWNDGDSYPHDLDIANSPSRFAGPSPPVSAAQSEDPDDAAISDERTYSAAPRLRRGGLRAPESMLSRHASPITIIQMPVSPVSEHDNPQDPATSYPTPGSTESNAFPTTTI